MHRPVTLPLSLSGSAYSPDSGSLLFLWVFARVPAQTEGAQTEPNRHRTGVDRRGRVLTYGRREI